MKRSKIRVLVVDDSAFMRKALKRMLNSDPLIRVIDDARDGDEAVEKVRLLNPDVVTMDVRMSRMDGLQALELIMRENPVPVLMVSSLPSEGGAITLKALELGAVDFIDKSSCHTTMDIINIADSLVEKVKVIAGVDLKKVIDTKSQPVKIMPSPEPVLPAIETPTHLVAIGASTGGPMSLERVLSGLPGRYSGAILIVQHMPVGFTKSLSDRLNTLCQLSVMEAKEDEKVIPGSVLIAPGGYHLKLRRSNDSFYAALSKQPRDALHIPSVDVMMESVAHVWPGRMLGIILTGMGSDGAAGIQDMKKRGATILAQDEETCVVFGMPRAAYLSGCVDRMVPLKRMSEEIYNFNNQEAAQ